MAVTSNPGWKKAVKTSTAWEWRDGKLWHARATINPATAPCVSGLQSRFVGSIYADQNRSPAVRRALAGLLDRLGPNSAAVNIGAGGTRYQGVANLEISDGANVDIVGYGSELPFQDGSIDLVIMQEVLEHVGDFLELVTEIRRILKPGGLFYCQVPFQIGFHPGPMDYWRFTRQGLEHVFSSPRWEIKQLAISLGHGSGFYRIAVEFFAVTASCVWAKAYRPIKALAAIGLYPLKAFDLLTRFSPEKDRIPGGYFCIAAKCTLDQTGQ